MDLLRAVRRSAVLVLVQPGWHPIRWSTARGCGRCLPRSVELRRLGAGRALYDVLLPRLAELGYRRAFAGITLPDESSLGLHTAFGFTPSGTYRRVGWKFDRWHDVAWLQRDLGEPGTELDPPGPAA